VVVVMGGLFRGRGGIMAQPSRMPTAVTLEAEWGPDSPTRPPLTSTRSPVRTCSSVRMSGGAARAGGMVHAGVDTRKTQHTLRHQQAS